MKQDTIRVGAVIAAGGMAQRMQGVDKQSELEEATK